MMQDVGTRPGGAALREEVFRLNLAYLVLAQRLVAEDPVAAGVVFGVREPLLAWLRTASIGAITTLARSPVTLFAPRFPRQGAERVLAACSQADGLGVAHLTMTAVAEAGESAR
jgi:Flagellar transcriptional activator (FlhD)